MYGPEVTVPDVCFGNVLRYGARVELNCSFAPYHAPVKPKLTFPLESPFVNTSSAPNSGGMFVAAKVWKDSTPRDAVAISRFFQVYSKTIAEGGAGKVCTSIEVTIPKDGEAPRMAYGIIVLSSGSLHRLVLL
jgi:hypothetical protein